MTTSAPSSSVLTTKYVFVHKESLEFNPWNPNKMTGPMYAKALESIELYGFIDPLLVREIGPGRIQIIDGEHRFRAGVDLGMDEFPCIKIKADDATAKKLTIVMNELHGQSDPGKMGDLLADILALTSLDDLLVGLPYDESVLAGFLNLPSLPPLEAATPPAAVASDQKEVWVERLFRMPKSVALVVDEAIEKARNHEEIEAWQGLERVAADYLAG